MHSQGFNPRSHPPFTYELFTLSFLFRHISSQIVRTPPHVVHASKSLNCRIQQQEFWYTYIPLLMIFRMLLNPHASFHKKGLLQHLMAPHREVVARDPGTSTL